MNLIPSDKYYHHQIIFLLHSYQGASSLYFEWYRRERILPSNKRNPDEKPLKTFVSSSQNPEKSLETTQKNEAK